MKNEILTTDDSARRLNLSADRVRQLEREGKLPALKTRNGQRLFKASDVVTFPQFRGHRVKQPPSSLRTRPGSYSQGSSAGASDYRTPRYIRRCPVWPLHGSRSADGTRARA